MFQVDVLTDANGIVLFDPSGLREWLGSRADKPQDLLALFLSSDAGDEVLARGLIVPVLAIDDGGYEVIVRLCDEPSPVASFVCIENGDYALATSGTIAVADLLALREWDWLTC